MSSTLNDKFSRLAALRPARKREPAETHPERARSDHPDALAELLGAVVARNRYGEHLQVRQWHSTPEPCAPSARALRLLLPNAGESAAALERLAQPADWLFLDTETTGLAGGTGTYAFLVGVAWWEAGGLQVEQFFMRDYDDEHSLLLELARRLTERRVLVTFNGKSFDWPLLETRFRMTRAIAPQPPAAHLDVLHPSRQLWRLRLGSVRLTELERHVLGTDALAWSRQDDIDSALIPRTYFDYLRGGPLEPLVRVFRHNQMDLRGLAALAGKIFSLLAQHETLDASAEDASALAEDQSSNGLELYGLSRLLSRRGEVSGARRLYERALAARLPSAVGRAARRELALLAKREHDYARANALWEDLTGDADAALEAYEQLAIHYEHRMRQPHRAAEFTREALAELRRALRSGRFETARCRRLQARLEHRLARLTRKTALSLLGLGSAASREATRRNIPGPEVI